MAAQCAFALNGKPLSTLTCDGSNYIAFSGTGNSVNKREAVANVNEGPLPPGKYYIVDRQSGGHLGWLWDLLAKEFSTDRSEWFALYRDDGVIDDQTVINGIIRGSFRLHPIGPRRLSEGCITLMSKSEFDLLRARLLAQPAIKIPGTGIRYYGTVDVQ